MSRMLQRRPSTTIPGIVLICAGVLSALAMAFHPAARGGDTDSWLHGLAAISASSMHVHMAMILFVIALWLTLAYITRAWPSSGWVWTASRLYTLGAFSMVGAALISGFVTGAYVTRALPAVSTPEDAVPSVLLAFSTNQALAGLGTVLMSSTILLWSIELVRDSHWTSRAAGSYGIAAGILCMGSHAVGAMSLDVGGMTSVVVAHGIWYCLLGLSVLRQSGGDDSHATDWKS